jgi:hypothetical protein
MTQDQTMTHPILTTLALTGMITTAAVGAEDPKPELTFNFADAEKAQMAVTGGEIALRGDSGTLKPNGAARAVMLAQTRPWSAYRVRVRAKSSAAMKLGDSFGVIAHAIDPNHYYLFRIIQKKGGVFGELLIQSDRKLTLATDFLVGDIAPVSIDPTQWHELAIDVDATNVVASIDGKPLLTYGFAARPTATYPHPPMWQQDVIAGVPGLYAQGASADFADFTMTRPKIGTMVHSPLNPPRDRWGMIQPRRTYDQLIRDTTNWVLTAKNVTHVPDVVPAVARQWDPILLVSYVFVNDSIEDVSDMQYPGHNHPPTIMGLVDYYLYSGDENALAKAREIADWNLKYTIPSGWKLEGLPLSHFDYRKLKADGSYEPSDEGYEPDKAANSGLGFIYLYAVTQDERYLKAAQRIANVLLEMQFDAGNFPFRVKPRTGAVEVEYTCSILWYVQFLELLAQFTPDPAEMTRIKSARDRAFAWLLKGPVRDNNWRGFYGDIVSGSDSLDQWTALDTAMYLIDAREQDPKYLDMALGIIAFCNDKLVTLDGFHPGVPCLIEQTTYSAVLSHHVARLADAYARLYGATANPEHARLAQLIANSTTWLQKADGKFAHGFWYHAQGNAYILNFVPIYMRIMSELPRTAPENQNHLLRTTALLRSVRYGEPSIDIAPWSSGQMRLKLATRPAAVEGAGQQVQSERALKEAKLGWWWDATLGTLDVRHGTDLVRVKLR